MVEDELSPDATGTIKTEGKPDNELGKRLATMQEDIERHGEVHAVFEHEDDDVEVRLGTAVLDYDAGLIRVFDGDQYRSFNARRLVDWEVPMDLFH